MMELAMASLHPDLKPPIGLKEIDEVFDLHASESTPSRYSTA